MKKDSKSPVHVRITDPKGVRREILETAEECIEVLQSGKAAYEKLNAKNLERKTIVKDLDELNKLLGSIERALPKLPGQKETKKKKAPVEKPEPIVIKPVIRVQKEEEKAVTYSQKLDQELREIKNKLAAL